MKNTQRATLAVLFAVLSCWSMPAAAAKGCKPVLVNGVITEYCDFSLLFSKYENVFFDFRPRSEIRLPNLVPDGINVVAYGGVLTSAVDVENINAVGAFSHTVNLAVVLTQTGGRRSTIALTARVPGVPGGQSVRVALPDIDMVALGFTRDDDIDVIAMLVIDPVQLPPAPRWGDVLEANESDNTRSKSCRIFGRVRFDNSVRQC